MSNVTVVVDETVPCHEIASEHIPSNDEYPAVIRWATVGDIRIKVIKTNMGFYKTIVAHESPDKNQDATLYEGDRRTAVCVFRAVEDAIHPHTFNYPGDLDAIDLGFMTVKAKTAVEKAKETIGL